MNVNFPGYYISETVEHGYFPENGVGYQKTIRIINNLDYCVYIHSVFPVAKIKPNIRNVNEIMKKELIIFCKSENESGKTSLIKITIDDSELKKNMVFIKELNILVCTKEDYYSNDEDRVDSVLLKEINSIDKYIPRAINQRILKTGQLPVFFNFNDPSNKYKKVYLYLFGDIVTIKIDNNRFEDPIAQIIIEDNKRSNQQKFITLDPEKIFNDKEALHGTIGDIDILCCVNIDILRRAITAYNNDKASLVSFKYLKQNEADIENRYQIQFNIKDAKIKELSSLLEREKTERSAEKTTLNNKIMRLEAEINRLYQIYNAELNLHERYDKYNELNHKISMRKIHKDISLGKQIHDQIIADKNIKLMNKKIDHESIKCKREVEILKQKHRQESINSSIKSIIAIGSLIDKFLKL